MRHYFYILFLSVLWISCSLQDENISVDTSLQLIFSNDSVAFDTLLSESRSSTRRLSVYNPNDEAIEFSSISLGKGGGSDYSVIINGKKTNSVVAEKLNGGDSLLILVEVNPAKRNQDAPFLVKDSIIFNWNTNQ